MTLSLDQLKAVLATLPDPVFILTQSGSYAAVFGGTDPRYYHDGSGLVGCSLYDIMPADKADWIMEQVNTSLREQHLCTVEYGLSGSDVEGLEGCDGPTGELWFEGRIQPLPFLIGDERAVVWTARNITERYTLERELRRISEVDVLTGAFTRRRLMTELEEKYGEFRRYGSPTSLLMLDTDHFKQVNDQYGHDTGDEVLRKYTETCMQQLRDVDLFARFGGEEFVALLPQTGLQEAQLIAERLRQSVEATTITHHDLTLSITVSIGVSIMDEHDHTYESVLKRADDALYEAKRTGRNRVFTRTP